MTEGELALRDQAQYLSTYRRVLDYFDAVKVGLTATPARHTTDIFGRPVYTYSYREAVADDWLIDHEPPIRYQTLLSQHGIHFDSGQQVEAINLGTGEIETAELNDELHFELESFNKRVISEPFNRVICEQLAQELDPMGEEKTMIFCATDAHADMVKRLLGDAFKAVHGDHYNQAAVEKITGASDKVDQLIRRYKNERFPTIAITVDLLTTGIDVPPICHLVFMRRVRSRILYEQMIGRATRRCDEIGKTVFKIYDPVDLYASLQAVNTMQPLVKDPKVTLEQLFEELNNPAAHEAAGSTPGRSHAHDVLDQLNQKLMRVLRDAAYKAEKKPALREKLDQLEQQWGVPPQQLHRHLHQIGQERGPQAAADFLHHNTRLLLQLAEVKQLLGTAYMPVIANYGNAAKAGACTPSQRTTSTASATSCASKSTSRLPWRRWSTAPRTSLANSSRKCACCLTAQDTPKPVSRPRGAITATKTSLPASLPTSAKRRWAKRCCPSNSGWPRPCRRSTPNTPGRQCSANG
jgi:type I restriction enzyme R subunit